MTKKIMKSLSLVCAVLLFFSLNVMAVSPEDADDVFYVNGIRVDRSEERRVGKEC